jgi:NAD(P)-dependent dehydrogenase (short-subunit alcohol dehydrogenase family)
LTGVITGGGGGIGAAIALALARKGFRIVLADLNAKAMASTVAALEGIDAEVLAVAVDVRIKADVERLRDVALERFGAVDVICNNAGVVAKGLLVDAGDAQWQQVMAVNFWGVVHGVQTFAPLLVKQGHGHIVNVASMAGLQGSAGWGVYSASKFAVVGLSEALYQELKPLGIGVSVVCPMLVMTDILKNSSKLLSEGKTTSASVRRADAKPKTDDIITPEEVAAKVVRAIDRKWFYVLTHEEQAEILQERSEALERAVQRMREPLDQEFPVYSSALLMGRS